MEKSVEDLIKEANELLNGIKLKPEINFLQEATESLKEIKKTLCRKCKKPKDREGNYCSSCMEESSKNSQEAKKTKLNKNSKGYIYGYDENGKSKAQSRILMEQKLGRALEDYEQVSYKDRDRTNLALDNLILVYKNGIGLDMLTCRCCGARGNWEINDGNNLPYT